MVRIPSAGLLIGLALASPVADAHGIWGHVHVTGWSVENMPDDELRAFLLEPEVFNALLFGAVFTDTGYALPGDANRAYSEHTHWEPFVDDYVEWIRVNDPPPWTSMESKKRVAFLMGCASHGLQDSIFDTLFLAHMEEFDSAGQDEADPGTDGFLVMDEHVRFVPEEDLPMDTLLELYADLEHEITEELILDSVGLVTGFYINDGPGIEIARALGEQAEDVIPWTRTHYMDPSVPGSLRSEIFPTMRHQQAIWSRLHGELSANDVTAFAFPEAPRRLITGDHNSSSSWASLVFGAGVRYEDDLLEWTGPDGAVNFTQGNTRWGAGHTRIITAMPDEPLDPGGWYTLSLRPGIEIIDGQVSDTAWELEFQVECDASTADLCPELPDIDVAGIDGVLEENKPPQTDEERGCGCVTAPAPGTAPIFGLAALAVVFIRRRMGARR